MTSVGRGEDDVPPVDYRAATRAWARVQVRALVGAGPVPEYGTAEWCALPPRDRRRFAALILAAERSQQQRPLVDRTESPRRRPWRLQATPGWPPVAIPGAPGHHLVPDARGEAA
ncbi:hypothetical protein [Streptomyces sp. NPDC059787]|uniref:hypothetical protein n=1 Tax=Streptomyces sp. NPDC059787 TaxID=3346947 RepID=UPI0036583C88